MCLQPIIHWEYTCTGNICGPSEARLGFPQFSLFPIRNVTSRRGITFAEIEILFYAVFNVRRTISTLVLFLLKSVCFNLTYVQGVSCPANTICQAGEVQDDGTYTVQCIGKQLAILLVCMSV